MAEDTFGELSRDLVLLGRSIDTPRPSEDLGSAVLARIFFVPPPAQLAQPTTAVGRWWESVKDRLAAGLDSRRARMAVVIATVLLALLATPPVRAVVADWFGFGGVIVETGTPEPGAVEPPPVVTRDLSVTEAADSVEFPVSVPVALGDPDGVEVSPDGRTVSMSWSSGPDGVVRLDQFAAGLDYSVIKQTPGFTFTTVGGDDGIWFEEPHDVALLNEDGTPRTESARLAGQTLVWVNGSTTLRLEGDLTLPRAIEIAESSQPVN